MNKTQKHIRTHTHTHTHTHTRTDDGMVFLGCAGVVPQPVGAKMAGEAGGSKAEEAEAE